MLFLTIVCTAQWESDVVVDQFDSTRLCELQVFYLNVRKRSFAFTSHESPTVAYSSLLYILSFDYLSEFSLVHHGS